MVIFPELARRFREAGMDDWKCKAQPRAADPFDCDWPNCGCDPDVERFIERLLEAGWTVMNPEETKSIEDGCVCFKIAKNSKDKVQTIAVCPSDEQIR